MKKLLILILILCIIAAVILIPHIGMTIKHPLHSFEGGSGNLNTSSYNSGNIIKTLFYPTKVKKLKVINSDQATGNSGLNSENN